MKLLFQLDYTRDTSFIPQEFWSRAYNNLLGPALRKEPPKVPFVLNYMNEGAIEIWVNTLAQMWIMDNILEKNNEDHDFLSGYVTEHVEFLKKLKPYWERGYAESLDDLQKFLKISYEANRSFMIFYYSSMDERTPKELRLKAQKLREKDIFYDKTDKVTRDTLLRIYPELKGVETTILSSEIGKKIPARKDLEKRKKNSILIVDKYFATQSLEDFISKNPEYYLDIVKVPKNISVEGIKGNSAYNGIVKGFVRVLRRKEQIESVQEGEIIVAPMTTPDYIPAMKKAAAFVTDEGGIMCHAAIVAREMKKPCVIGTKIATKVLKDGDLVEVDAHAGIVRVLKH